MGVAGEDRVECSGDGAVRPGVSEVDQQGSAGAVCLDPLVGVALVEEGVEAGVEAGAGGLAVLAEAFQAAAGWGVGRNLPEVFGAVEVLFLPLRVSSSDRSGGLRRSRRP